MLISCPECGSQVSDKAKSCPHCGYSLEDEREEKALIEAALRAAKAQEEYDATFKPSELYLSAPMPFKLFCRPFTARGRATRAEFWFGFLFYVASTILLTALALHFSSETQMNPLMYLVFVWVVYGTIALYNATERRLHDAGASDALAVILLCSILIPVFGWGFLLLCGGVALFSPSVTGSNEHGPNPDVFYYTNPERPVPRPQMKQVASQQIHREPPVAQRNVIVFNCPCCGKECESEEEIQVGQHVLCPFCGEKFSFAGAV